MSFNSKKGSAAAKPVDPHHKDWVGQDACQRPASCLHHAFGKPRVDALGLSFGDAVRLAHFGIAKQRLHLFRLFTIFQLGEGSSGWVILGQVQQIASEIDVVWPADTIKKFAAVGVKILRVSV
tara:strand:- start:1659 stop:2027 length:369 start_codon:yes stop_codon:yes gene_type:complete